VRTIDDLLEDVPALTVLAPGHRATIAGCGRNRVFSPGAQLMREGEPADSFFVVREGTVALETWVPQRGAIALATLHAGDLLGWSWLVEPFTTTFDARAISETHAIVFDAACLRGKFESDPALGYALHKVFAGVIVERLQAARFRLLDVYGKAHGEPVPSG
jgi:CRP/FNR family cyclic AMP-dependent transcriptional regulator